MFLSNASAQNPLAYRLKATLDAAAIDVFHYTDEDRDPASGNFRDEIRHEIGASVLFIALIGPGFVKSRFCLEELDITVAAYKAGTIQLLTYKIGIDREPPALWSMEKHIQGFGEREDG